MPASAGAARTMRSAFHPMCGTLRAGSAAKRATRPGRMPRPATGPNSSLSSKRSCMPRQMPRKGRPARMACLTGSTRPSEVRFAMQAPKAPTPGRTTPGALAMRSGSRVTSAAFPRIVRRSRHDYPDGLLEEPLGREHADDARVALGGEIERARQRLEDRLDDVVRVAARGHADVEVHARLVGECQEEVVDQLDVERADLRLLDPDVVDEEGPPREVDHGRHQRLVERHGRLAEAADAGLLAERVAEGLPEGEPDAFDRVVVVDL